MSLYFSALFLLLTLSTKALADGSPPDNDGDGYAADLDCDDTDFASNPGIDLEECDGKDNNCDGVIDRYEQDQDQDGLYPCSGDCDDLNPARYAGAPEQPDEVDNDCDDQLDEGTVWGDDDGDGYSELPPGAAVGSMAVQDCDDNNPAIHPEAEDSDNPADGVDNDCDWLLDEGELDADMDLDGYSALDGDCDDEDPARHPDAEEPDDGVDYDCDGQAAIAYGCARGQAQHGALGVLVGFGALRRRRMRAAVFVAALAAVGTARAADPGPSEVIATTKLSAPSSIDQAHVDYYAAWPELVRASDALFVQSAAALDQQWAIEAPARHQEALRQQARKDEADATFVQVMPAKTTTAATEAPAQSIEIRNPELDVVSERLQSARVREVEQLVLVDRCMEQYGLHWGDSVGVEMWAGLLRQARLGDLEPVIEAMQTWPGSWPITGEPPTHVIQQLLLAQEAIRDRENLELRYAELQAHPYILTAPEAPVIEPMPPAQALDELEGGQAKSPSDGLVPSSLLSLAAPMPLPGAMELRAKFDKLLLAFLRAPTPLSSARWAELWWRHGLVALLAGDEDAAWRSLWQAAAVAGVALPQDQLPPTLAALLRQAQLEQAATDRGTLWLSVDPSAEVLVDGRPVATTFGEAELPLPPGLHLIVITKPGIELRHVAVYELRSGRDLVIRWNPALRVSGDPKWESLISAVRVVDLPLEQEEAPASWSFSMGTRGLTAADTVALGGMVGVAWSHNRAELWTDVAGLRLVDPVLVSDAQYARWLTAISAGAGWRGGSDSFGLLLGGGGYVYPTLAFGPMGRSGVWFERGALGVGVEGRIGWDLAQHTADVPRLTVGVGLSANLHRGRPAQGAR